MTTQRGSLIEVVTLDAEAKKMSTVVEPWWAQTAVVWRDSTVEHYFGSSVWVFDFAWLNRPSCEPMEVLTTTITDAWQRLSCWKGTASVSRRYVRQRELLGIGWKEWSLTGNDDGFLQSDWRKVFCRKRHFCKDWCWVGDAASLSTARECYKSWGRRFWLILKLSKTVSWRRWQDQ